MTDCVHASIGRQHSATSRLWLSIRELAVTRTKVDGASTSEGSVSFCHHDTSIPGLAECSQEEVGRLMVNSPSQGEDLHVCILDQGGYLQPTTHLVDKGQNTS